MRSSSAVDTIISIWYDFNALSGSNSVVECNLAKVDVAGSNPVSRSIITPSESSASELNTTGAYPMCQFVRDHDAMVSWRPAVSEVATNQDWSVNTSANVQKGSILSDG